MSFTEFDRNLLDSLFVGYKMQFKDGMQKASDAYKNISTLVQSQSAIEAYPIIDQFSSMREWIGPRQIETLKVRNLIVKNRDFEHAIRVSRNAIADEQCGLYGAMISGLGMAAENMWDDLVFNALTANDSWLDQSPFFGTRSYEGGGTITNQTANALSHNTYAQARQSMLSYVGHGGSPLNVVPDTLVVGPALEGIARSILEGQFKQVAIGNDSALADNTLRGTAKLMISTRLVGEHANKWYLMATNDVIRPIILQQRQLPRLSRIDSEESEFVFKYNENLYGTHARGAAALAAPHLIFAGLVPA